MNIKKIEQRAMKHFRNKQKCECKSYFLERSKTLFIENNNFTKLRKRYKKREICLYPPPFLSLSFLFYSFWWLSLVKVSFFVFIKLTQQGDDCVFKDLCAISFYNAQYVSWTDNGRSFHHSTGRLSGSQKESYGTFDWNLYRELVVSWELVI